MTTKPKPAEHTWHVLTLARCFRRLSPDRLANLVWHVKQGTRIYCGQYAMEIGSPASGG